MTVAELVALFRVEGLSRLTTACEVASQSLHNVRRTADEVSTAFGDLGRLAGAGFMAMAGSLVGLTKAGFQLELVSRRAAFSLANIFGSVELGRQAMERLVREAEKSQLQLSDMIPLFTKLSGAFMAAFKDPQTAMEQAFRTLRVIGDVASSMQLPTDAVQRMALALTQMTAKPKLVAEELRQLAEATQLPIYDIMARALARQGKRISFDTGELRKAGVTGAQAATALVEELDRMFGGAQAKMVNTFEGALSNLRDAWARFSRELVRGGIDPITQGLIGLKDKFSELADEAERTGKLREAFQAFAGSILTLTAVVIAAIDTFASLDVAKQKAIIRTTVYGTVIMGLTAVTSFAVSMFAKLISVLMRILQVIVRLIGYLPRVAQFILMVARRMGLWGWVITAVITGLGLMIRHWDAVRAVAWRTAAAIVDAMRTAAKAVGAIGLTIAEAFKALASLQLPDVGRIYQQQLAKMEQATKGWDLRTTQGYKRAMQAAEQASKQAQTQTAKAKQAGAGIGFIEAIKQFPQRVEQAYKRLSQIKIATPTPGKMADIIKSTNGLAGSTDKAEKAARKHRQSLAEQESAVEALVDAMRKAEIAGKAVDSAHREALETLARYKDGARYVEAYLRVLALTEFRQARMRSREDLANLRQTLDLYRRFGDIELARELTQLMPAIPAERLSKLGLDAYALLVDLARERKQLEDQIDEIYDRQRRELQAIRQLSEYIVDTQTLVEAGGNKRLAQIMEEYQVSKDAAESMLKLQIVLGELAPDTTELSNYIQMYHKYGKEVAELAKRYPGLAEDTLQLLKVWMYDIPDALEHFQDALRKTDQALITTGEATNELYSKLPRKLRSELASTLSEVLTLGREYDAELRRIVAQLSSVDLEVTTEPMLDQLTAVRNRVVDLIRQLREALAVTKMATPEQRQWLDILVATLGYLDEAIERGQEELRRFRAENLRAQAEYMRARRELEIDEREQALKRKNDLRGLIALYKELIDQLWTELQIGQAVGALTYDQRIELERRVQSYRRAMEEAQDKLREQNRRLVAELERDIKGAFVGFFERLISGTSNLRNAFKQLLADIRQAIARMIAEWIIGRIVAWWRKVTHRNPAEEALVDTAAGIIRGGGALNIAVLGLVGVLAHGKLTLGRALMALVAVFALQAVIRSRLTAVWLAIEQAIGNVIRIIAQSGPMLSMALLGLVGIFMQGRLTLGRALVALVAVFALQAVIRSRLTAVWLAIEQAIGSVVRVIAQSGPMLSMALLGLAGVFMQGRVTLGRVLATLAATLAAQAVIGRRKGGGWLGAVLGVIAGFLQSGGRVQPGRAYVVGERGPELFVPATAGLVVPNVGLPAITPATVNVSVAAHFYGDFRYAEDINRVADQLASLVVRRIRGAP
jgi:tape measure domain-containing protein